jgi:glycosyltransferase involved in cell wall biosynthesis
VTDIELNVLYAEAEALVFPSLDEGFGLPILEAFYHGTPVITSQVTALVEVAGNAAELVDPLAVEDIRRGIELVLKEDEQAQRSRLQKMIIRSHMFGWHQVANQTLAVYAKAIQHHE